MTGRPNDWETSVDVLTRFLRTSTKQNAANNQAEQLRTPPRPTSAVANSDRRSRGITASAMASNVRALSSINSGWRVSGDTSHSLHSHLPSQFHFQLLSLLRHRSNDLLQRAHFPLNSFHFQRRAAILLDLAHVLGFILQVLLFQFSQRGKLVFQLRHFRGQVCQARVAADPIRFPRGVLLCSVRSDLISARSFCS